MKTKKLLSLAGLALALLMNPAPARGQETNLSVVLSLEGKVEISRAGAADWSPAKVDMQLSPGDRVRTGPGSRAAVRLYNQSVLRISEVTTLTIQAPPNKKSPLLDLKSGSVFMFDRGRPSDLEFRAKKASGAVRGTEFFLAAGDDDKVTVAVFDGAVDVNNEISGVTLGSGEQSVVEDGKAPAKTAVINAMNLVQWCLYYPGVLNSADLGLGGVAELSESLAAYQGGDLLGALDKYPAGRAAASETERVYRAGLLLAVGQAPQAEALLAGLPAEGNAARMAAALRTLIMAVKFEPRDPAITGPAANATASEWLAESYYRQSRSQLALALDAARKAAQLAPDFGFARARAAELEFGFGRVRAAQAELERGLALSPRNAQALALRGFLLSAEGRFDEAIAAFNGAMAVDGSLANAWLGRGLCRIRKGQMADGRQDLQAAAALEPQRSILRSYLGKAYGHSGDAPQAERELSLARKLDPNDPTPPFYRALLNRQENKINAAVRDLEESIRLNDNRSVYRSRLLLDQDRAVRSANLAGIYQDAGMADVALQEAYKAVGSDYGNYSAHLFLANSYDALRDARASNLRYETPWLSEYLLANLLSPANAGALSQQVSQNEYSRLFDRDRVGFASRTDYYSNGDWVQGAAQFGVLGGTAWNVETLYRSENGQGAPNMDLEHLTVSVKLKQQLTAKDMLYVQAVYFNGESGDISLRYNPAGAVQGYRLHDYQEPLVMAGYHREWSPGNHTLVLFTRLSDRLNVDNPAQQTFIFDVTPGSVIGVGPVTLNQQLREETTVYTGEIQQIIQRERHNTILGARLQTADFDVFSRQTRPSAFGPFFATPFPANQNLSLEMNRVSGYAYHFWEIAAPLTLAGGVTYDHLQYPVNHRLSPISAREESVDRLSPKAGFIWTPFERTTVRGGYARYLGGVSFEQSFVLEPTQVAGFNQALRSIIPEMVFGPTPAARAEVFGLALEQKLPTHTYLGVSGELLFADASRELGVFNFTGLPPFVPSTTREQFDFRERTLRLYANQLLGEEWSLGAAYRLSHAESDSSIPAIPSAVSPFSRSHTEALLQQVNLQLRFNHRCGFFSRMETLWTGQHNLGYTPDRPGDNFWQLNAFAGYRFRRGQAEVQVGVLNIADQDYRLNPLNTWLELPRERTFFASLFFRF